MFEAFKRPVTTLFPELRADERSDAVGALVTLFGVMAGHALLETGRDALFLAGLPAVRLPWAYLAIAGAALLLTRIPDDLVRRLSPKHELSGWLVLAGAVTGIFWVLLGAASRPIAFALYVWTGVLATVVVVRFWITLGNLFTVTQAKRIFPIVGVGSLLGALSGSGLARVMTAALPARHVVLAAALIFLATSLAPRLLRRATRLPTALPAGAKRGAVAETVTTVWRHAYLRRVVAIILLATVAFTLVDFVFKSVVDRTVPIENMGAFFSTVYLGINVIALGFQLLVVSRLVRGFGVHVAQMVVPVMILMGGLGFVVFGGLAMAVILKGVDGSMRHSMYRTTTELFFVPLSADLRGRVKTVIDVVGQRGGQAIASLLILIGASLTGSEVLFAAVAVAAAGCWVVLNRSIRSHYIDVFRQTLSEDVTETRVAFPALDVASLETLLSTLNAMDDRKVMAALDLLVAQGKIAVIPALILYHPSPPVVCHALDLFLHSTRDDFLPIVQRLIEHPDADVRTAAVRVLSVRRPDDAVLRAALQDGADAVRATALVGLVVSGSLESDDGLRELATIADGGSDVARVALAHAIHDQPSAIFEAPLARLAKSEEPEVLIAVVRAMQKVQSPTFIPILFGLLDRRTVRADVRETLASFTPPPVVRLGKALSNHEVPHRVRRHIPAVLSDFGSPQAARTLLDALIHETDGMIRFKILRALGRLHSNHAGLPLDLETVDRIVEDSVGNAFRLMRWRQKLDWALRQRPELRTSTGQMLLALLLDKEDHAFERVCRLLNLRWRTEDFLRVHRGFNEGDPLSVASSRELLEQLAAPPLRGRLLELVDDLYDAQGRDGVRPAGDASHGDVLLEMYNSPMESLSSIAAHYLAELREAALIDQLEARPEFSAYHRDILSQVKVSPVGRDRG